MGRRRKGEDDSTIKNRLLDRLGELFFSRRLVDYTMDEVAQTFRVSKKTLYRFFPTRDEMMLQVARIFISRINRFADKKIRTIEARGPDSYLPQLMEFVGRIGSTMILALPAGFMTDMERRSPLLYARLEAMRRETIMTKFSRLLDLGKTMGHVRPDIDSEVASHVYTGMIRQIVAGPDIGPTHAPYDVFVTVVKIIFSGVLKPGVRLDLSALKPVRRAAESPWEELRALAEEPSPGEDG